MWIISDLLAGLHISLTEPGRKMKGAAFSRLTLDPDFSTHHLDKSSDKRKSKTHPTIFSGA
jgi:hypothetical protein